MGEGRTDDDVRALRAGGQGQSVGLQTAPTVEAVFEGAVAGRRNRNLNTLMGITIVQIDFL